MLLALSYHKTGIEKYANSIELLKEHLNYISKNFQTVFPSDKLNPFKTYICLSFDDGYFDFYHNIFPILRKLNLKAVLAIPAKYILDTTNIDFTTRLSISHKEAYKDNIYVKNAPFCTYTELKEMLASNLIKIASHSYSHINLLDKEADMNLEIVESKIILEKKLNVKIDTFVYPLGKFDKKIHKKVKENYAFAFRLGNAINFSWQNISKITYRICSDRLKSKKEPFKIKNLSFYFLRFLINSIRKR